MASSTSLDGRLLDEHNARTTAVRTVLRDFTPDEFEPGKWFIDLAMTLSAKRDQRSVCLFVNRQLHPEIIAHFTGIPVDRCARWVETNSGGYAPDEEAHLGYFAGFRMTLDEPGQDDIYYLQVYTSNKSVTYHLDGQQIARRTSPQRILENWQAERRDYFLPFQNALINASRTHSVAVRFESRIEFFSYPYVHHAMSAHTVKPWLLFLRNSHYW